MPKQDDAQDGGAIRLVGTTRTSWTSEAFTANDGTTVYLYALADMPRVTVVADSDHELMTWLRILLDRFLPPEIRAQLVSVEAEAEGAEAVKVNTRPGKGVN